MQDRYRMYVDESGNADFNNVSGMNKYLTLTGVIIKSSDKIEVAKSLNILKYEIFNFDIDTDHWSLHKKDAVNKKNYYKVLGEESARLNYNVKLVEFLKNVNMTIISVTLDKESLFNKYGEKSKNPYHYVLENLLKRYVLFLNDNSAIGDVLIEGRTPQNNLPVKECFKHIYSNGTKKAFGQTDIPASLFQKRFTSTEIKIEGKEDNVAGLQIADTLTSALRNYALYINGEKIETKYGEEYWKKIIGAVGTKIRKYNTTVKGAGIIFIKF